MGVVSTTAGKCKKCYSCVRNCPVKAIKVENEQAQVLAPLCISCGHCLKVCSQRAKQVESEATVVEEFLAHYPTVACLAPSFAVEFYPIPPGSIITALKLLGFQEVYEVAYGAELVTQKYRELVFSRQETQGLISTTCPAVVSLVEKCYPELLPKLVPVVSPMIATGQYLKRLRPEAKVVFIGPCIAKKEEARDANVPRSIDAVLTFDELETLWQIRGLEPVDLPVGRFSNPPTSAGRLYPVPGGLLASAGLSPDFVNQDLIAIHGKENCLEFLKAAASGKAFSGFVDILFCEGCINGPMLQNDLPKYTRQKIIAWYLKNKGLLTDSRCDSNHLPKLNLNRKFENKSITFPQPNDEEIKAILEGLGKTKPEDELNCGACGYTTCREKAIAVYQGLAENVMCLPYLIGELQKNNQELTYLKEYNNNIVKSIAETILVVNRQGIITTCHDPNSLLGAKDIHSYLGQNYLELLPPALQKEIAGHLQTVIEQGVNVVVQDICLPGEQGNKFINLKGYPFKDNTGRCLGAVLIWEDITLERRLEAQLLASEKLASVGRLAAGIAHEINNPLSLISGYTELLKNILPAGDQGARQKLDIISEEVERIAAIVRNLLTLARPAPGEITLCNINELLRHAVELVQHQYDLHGHVITLNLADGLPDLELNKQEIEQVFLNLLLNACEAMRESGRLSIDSMFEAGKSVVINFRDTGRGIPAEHLSKIFEPFFTTKEIGKGTGLGLAISYSIIQKYGGDILVDSVEGKGSTFSVRLPVKRCKNEQAG